MVPKDNNPLEGNDQCSVEQMNIEQGIKNYEGGPEDNTRLGENAQLNRRTLNKEFRIMKCGPEDNTELGERINAELNRRTLNKE